MGAIASGGVRVLNEDVVQMLRIPEEVIEATAMIETEELERRERLYRGDRPGLDAQGRVAILIDDGLATGSTMRAAAVALRRLQPSRVVIAVPVAAGSTCDELSNEVDEVICAETPEPFYAISLWYRDFTQTTDDEVRELLARSVRSIAA